MTEQSTEMTDPAQPAEGVQPAASTEPAQAATETPAPAASSEPQAHAEGAEQGSADLETSDDRGRESAAERLEREGDVAADYLERLLDVADLDGDIDVDIDGDRAAVAIVDSDEGRVPRRLVGRDGEVLEALQELTRLAVLAQTGERSRLMLDIAGHRAGRRQALVARAAEVVEQVKSSGERVALEPMSPFERKVVHDAVAEQGLATESEGVEPNRHVVVLPA